MATATAPETLAPLDPPGSPVRVLALRSVDGAGGGAEAILLRTAARLNSDRVRMTVCCIRRSDDEVYDFDRRAAALGIDYCEVPQRSILAGGVLAAIRRIAVQRQIEIVDAQDYKAAFFAFHLARREAVAPVATLHGWSGHHWRERLVYYPAERLLAATFPLAVAVSGEIRETLVRWGSRPERVHVLRNGIDPTEFRRTTATTARIRTALGIVPGDIVIGAVGRLECEKRFDVLLEAMASLLPRRPELKLIVVGEGSRREALQRELCRLGIADRCRLLGHRSDVRDVYQAMDVFVQSSDHEGSPTVVVEAMAMELPIVATGVGGTRELVEHGVHGLLVPRRNPSAMARAIEQTLDDPRATAQRVAAARTRAENELSFDARTRTLERLYGELAEHQRSQRRRV
jgi:glycosyltransferase involved in cell wall biosynthesis